MFSHRRLRARVSSDRKSARRHRGPRLYGTRRLLFVEWLEARLCLSQYNYTVITQTGQAGISAIREFPSINDSGEVAFIGALAAGGDAVFAGDGTAPPTNLSGPGSANTTYLASAQINDS